MKNTVTLDLDTLTSKVNNNNYLLKSISHLILISFIGLTIEFLIYIFQNPTKDDFILYTIGTFMIIISVGVGVSYYFLKKAIEDTLLLILTDTASQDEVTVIPSQEK